MRVGLVCPYDWDVPGGVQAHVRDLAEALGTLGHEASVLTPGDPDRDREPEYVVHSGRTVPVPYNGAVARLSFGLVSAKRVRRWLREGEFDVVHVHEPTAPSLSLLACYATRGPLVATFHTANDRSRLMSVAASALASGLIKIRCHIAVSEAARRTLVDHLGRDAVVIPNGVSVARFDDAPPLPDLPVGGATLGFLGRMDEPRKGLDVLLAAFRRLAPSRPGLRLLIAGPGDVSGIRADLPASLRDRVTLLGMVDEETKARMLRSVDVFVAPNTGQESFGVVLLEAMAAGTPVLASDIEAFRGVLGDGRYGELFPVGDSAALAAAADALLTDPERRRRLAAEGRQQVLGYDWDVLAARVADVYAEARRRAEVYGLSPTSG